MYEAPKAELLFPDAGELMNGFLESGTPDGPVSEWTENEK